MIIIDPHEQKQDSSEEKKLSSFELMMKSDDLKNLIILGSIRSSASFAYLIKRKDGFFEIEKMPYGKAFNEATLVRLSQAALKTPDGAFYKFYCK